MRGRRGGEKRGIHGSLGGFRVGVEMGLIGFNEMEEEVKKRRIGTRAKKKIKELTGKLQFKPCLYFTL